MRRDSGAVLIALGILFCRETSAQTWSVPAQPTLSIGEMEGAPEYLLNRVQHVRRMSDGRILVTMGPDIRFYDRAGKYVSRAGGRGGGPGEFQFIQHLLVLPGDTLLAINLNRQVWLNAHGEYLRQATVQLGPLTGDGWFTDPSAMMLDAPPSLMSLPNGNLLAMQYRRGPPLDFTQLQRPPVRYTVLDPKTGNTSPLVTAGGFRQMIMGERMRVQPFTPHAQYAIGPDRIYVGDNDTTFLNMFSLDGKPLGPVRVAERPIPVTSGDLSAYYDQTLQLYGTTAERKAEYERAWAAVPKPKRHPYFGTALVDRVGNLWVSGPLRPGRSAVTWTAFDAGGRVVGRVSMPAGFTPKEIGADYVLGVTRDESDVEYVRMHALIKR